MFGRVHETHCSSDALIAFADGGLSARVAQRVSAHLQECWACRARLSELNDTAAAVANIAAKRPCGGADRAAAAKAAFLDGCRRVDSDLLAATNERPKWYSRVAVIGAAALLLGLGVNFLRWPVASMGTQNAVLAAAILSEQQLIRTEAVVHQVVDVEVEQTAPVMRRTGGRLEIWADGSKRFASRWVDQRGELRFAAWQPSAGRQWVLDRATGPAARPVNAHAAARTSLLEVEAGRFEDLERSVLQWIRDREWRPVELAADFKRFVDREGAELRAEPDRTGSSQMVLKLKAQRAGVSGTVELELVLTSTHRPRLQKAVYRTGKNVLVVRLAMVREGAVPHVEPAIFIPKPGPNPSGYEDIRPQLPSSQPQGIAARDSLPSLSMQVRLMFDRHQAGHCESPLPAKRTLLPAGVLLNPALRDRIVEIARSRGFAEAPEEIAAGVIESVSLARWEAAELSHLTKWANAAVLRDLDEHDKLLMSRMVADHAARLRNRISRSQGVLEPVLAGLAHASAIAPPHGKGGESDLWISTSAHVLSHLERVERNVLRVFIEAAPAGELTARLAAEILHDLPTAEQELTGFEAEWLQGLTRGASESRSHGRP